MFNKKNLTQSRIDKNDSYINLGVLSSTQNSTVYLLRSFDNFQILKVGLNSCSYFVDLIKKEAEANRKLENLGAIKIIECFSDYDSLQKKEFPWLIMDFIPGINLFDFLESIRGRDVIPQMDLNMTFKYHLIYEIANSINNIHKQGYVHRDIKPHNIFLDGKFHVHIGDFGDLTNSKLSKLTTNVHGTINFLPPEGFPQDSYDEEYPISAKFDVYSFGGTLLQILTYEWPYSDITSLKSPEFMRILKERVLSGQIDNRFDKGGPLESQLLEEDKLLYELYKKCCAFNPDDRPTMEQVMNEIMLSAQHNMTPEDFHEFKKWTKSLHSQTNEEEEDCEEDESDDYIEEEEDMVDEDGYYGTKQNIILALQRGFHKFKSATALVLAAQSLNIDLTDYESTIVDSVPDRVVPSTRSICDSLVQQPHTYFDPEIG